MIWEPKPLRPMCNLPEDKTEFKIKVLSPIERQRAEDGSRVTVTGHSVLKPKEPSIIIKVAKGSLAEHLPPVTYKTETDPPQFCPHDFSELVKNYLNT